MPELVELTEHGEVSVVRLRREEKLNALSAEVEGALADALDDARVSGGRCVVFTGSERAFSAGADVNEFADLDPAAIAGLLPRDGRGLRARLRPAAADHCRHSATASGAASSSRSPATCEWPTPPPSSASRRSRWASCRARAERCASSDRRAGSGQGARDAGRALRRRRRARAGARDGGGGGGRRAAAVARARSPARRAAALALTTAKQAIDAMPDSSREAGLLLERFAYALLAQTAEANDAVERFGKRSGR